MKTSSRKHFCVANSKTSLKKAAQKNNTISFSQLKRDSVSPANLLVLQEAIGNRAVTGLVHQHGQSKRKAIIQEKQRKTGVNVIQRIDDDAKIVRDVYERFVFTPGVKEIAGLLGLPKPSARNIQAWFTTIENLPSRLDKGELWDRTKNQMIKFAPGIPLATLEKIFNEVYARNARKREKKKVEKSDFIPNKRKKLELPIPEQDRMPYLDEEQRQQLESRLQNPKILSKLMNAGFDVHKEIVEGHTAIGELVEEQDKDLSGKKLDQEETIAALDKFSTMTGPDKRGLQIGLQVEGEQVTFGKGGMMIPGLGTYAQEKIKYDNLIEKYDIKDTKLLEYAITIPDIDLLKEMCEGISEQEIMWLLRLSELHVLELFRSKPLVSGVASHQKLAMHGAIDHSQYMESSPMEPKNATTNLEEMQKHKLIPKFPALWKIQQERLKKGITGVSKVDFGSARVFDPTITPFFHSLLETNDVDSEPDEKIKKTMRSYLNPSHMQELSFNVKGTGKITGEPGLSQTILDSIETFPKIGEYLSKGIFAVFGDEWTCYIRCVLYHFGKIGQYDKVIAAIKAAKITIDSGVTIPGDSETRIRQIIQTEAGVEPFFVNATDVSTGNATESNPNQGKKINLILTGAHFSLLLS